MTAENGYDVLTVEQKIEILEQKILQYEASLWDATLELNVALAAEDDASIKTQTKRRADLEAAVQYLVRQKRSILGDGAVAPEAEVLAIDTA